MANYNFPQGISSNRESGQPYMMLTSYESKNAIESTGQTNFTGSRGTIKSSIALYIPPNALKTAFQSTYGADVAGAATKAAMASAWDKGSMGDLIMAGLKGTGISFVEKAAAQVDKGTGMLAAQGIAVNNHLGLTYKGPTQFRQHEFSFAFFPKNKGEAEIVKAILKDLENGMLPRMKGAEKVKGRTLSAPFFQSPRHWTIDFFKKTGEKNNYLFQIGKSVITAMSVNHDQQSTVSLHIKDESPVQTTLSITFQEIELRVSSDETIEGDTTITPATTQSVQQELEEALSDFRLKDNITLLQEEGFGIPNIYSFNYKWDTETTWIGVMAQELLDTRYSDAVGTNSEGFYWVDYSRLGFPMIGIN